MVEEVRAFKDASGKLHDSKMEAMNAEAVVELMKMEVFNHASALAIVLHADRVHAIISPLVEENH